MEEIDIVTRCNMSANGDDFRCDTCADAAAEIERLRKGIADHLLHHERGCCYLSHLVPNFEANRGGHDDE